MGKVFKDKVKRIFNNPNRHRVRFYSEALKKYYSVWIYNTISEKLPYQKHSLGDYITCKGDIMLIETLYHDYKYGGNPKTRINKISNIKNELNWDFQWDVIIK